MNGLVSFRACGIIDAKFKPQGNSRFEGVSEMTDEQLQEIAKRYAIGINDIKNYIRREQVMSESFLPELNEEEVLKQLEGIDVVVFAGGISPRLEGEEMPVQVPGFSGGDKTDIELPDVQRRLLKTLHDAGKKVILVNFSGSAIGLVPETESCDAILQVWYPGQEGGTAIADVLFGDVNPSGKLPVTFYRNADQLPDVEDYNMEGHTYRYFRGSPLYEFGYGLSYSRFTYGKPKVKDGYVEVKVRNRGKREGTEIVQLYVRKPSDTTGPDKTLRGFTRVSIPAGKSVKGRIPIDKETFLWWNEEAQDMTPVPGDYILMTGGSSADKSLKTRKYSFKG